MEADPLLRYDLGEEVEAWSSRKGAVLPYPVVMGHQVHGDRIAVITRPDTTRKELEGYDAFVTATPGYALAARSADCMPILIHDPVHKAVAAVHAGWKGTVRRISQKTLREMGRLFGTKPEDILAAIGPGIGPDSFQVGEEVVDAFRKEGFPMEKIWSWRGPAMEDMAGGHHIDLWEANRWLLEEAGVPEGHVHVAGIDTYRDETFYSARREGLGTGRIISSIRIIPRK